MKDPLSEAPLQRMMAITKEFLLPKLSERIQNKRLPIPKPIIKKLLNNGTQSCLLSSQYDIENSVTKGDLHGEAILVVGEGGITDHNIVRIKESSSIIQDTWFIIYLQ